MPITFTKLFTSITQSTVWLLPDSTRLAWITLLALADRQGRVFASVPGLAHTARIEVDDCKTALQTFMAPDPESRTQDWDGRRIEPIDGGWRLLNYEKYRALRDEEAIKESKRLHARRKRHPEISTSATVDPGRAIAEAEAEAEAEADKEPGADASGLNDDTREDPQAAAAEEIDL